MTCLVHFLFMFFLKKEKLYHQEKKKLSQTGLNKLSVGLTAEVPSCCFPGVDKCPCAAAALCVGLQAQTNVSPIQE